MTTHAPAIKRTAAKRRPRTVLYAHEKWGKTSFAAQANKPIILMAGGEDGLLTLLQSGQLKETDHFEKPAASYDGVMSHLRWLLNGDHQYGTLVIDTINAVEGLTREMVCQDVFQGNWRDYDSYGRGDTCAVHPFIDVLQLCDQLNQQRNMAIIMTAHCQVKGFNNPAGANYDRYQPELGKACWGELHKWADMILFGTFKVVEQPITGQKDKAKGKFGDVRVIYTNRAAAWDAGNRYGLPAIIECGSNGAAGAWARFVDAYVKAGKAAPTPDASGAAGSTTTTAAPATGVPTTPATPPAAAAPATDPPPGSPEPTTPAEIDKAERAEDAKEKVDEGKRLEAATEENIGLLKLCATSEGLKETYNSMLPFWQELGTAKREDLRQKLAAVHADQKKVLAGEGVIPF